MSDLRDKNRKTLLVTLGVVFGMIVLAYASVPLYDLICKQIGWGGTTMSSTANPNTPTARDITVRFNSSVARGMPWTFTPDINSVNLKVGADGIISFVAENKSDKPVTGTAVYNVTPLKAGPYFYKTQCFCFGEQTLHPGQKVHMPVTFYIDPKIMDDPEMKDVDTITLSYTFFRHASPELEKATEAFYNQDVDSKIN